MRITDPADVAAGVEALGGERLVESVIADRELSVVVARGVDGDVVDHGVMENTHANHILDTTTVPARVPDATAEAAVRLLTCCDGLGLVGVLCVELFDTAEGILVNEIAPRPHNSGHCTIEAAAASQFEQQLRAVTGQPLGDGSQARRHGLGLPGDLWDDGEPDWTAALANPVCTCTCTEREARTGRKMVHLGV